MKEVKKRALRVFLAMEIASVGCYYLFGTFGLQALKRATRQNDELLQDLKLIEHEVTTLATELDERSNNPFYKESIARKELQMAYENEIIYLLPKKG